MMQWKDVIGTLVALPSMTLDVSAKNITCVKINGSGQNLLHTPEKVILLVFILEVIIEYLHCLTIITRYLKCYYHYWRRVYNFLFNLQTENLAIIALIFILKENAMFGKMMIASPRMKVHFAHLIPKDWWDVSQEVYNCLQMYSFYVMLKTFWSYQYDLLFMDIFGWLFESLHRISRIYEKRRKYELLQANQRIPSRFGRWNRQL